MSSVQGTPARITSLQQSSRHYFQRPDAGPRRGRSQRHVAHRIREPLLAQQAEGARDLQLGGRVHVAQPRAERRGLHVARRRDQRAHRRRLQVDRSHQAAQVPGRAARALRQLRLPGQSGVGRRLGWRLHRVLEQLQLRVQGGVQPADHQHAAHARRPGHAQLAGLRDLHLLRHRREGEALLLRRSLYLRTGVGCVQLEHQPGRRMEAGVEPHAPRGARASSG